MAEQTTLGRNAVVKLMHPELSRDPSYVARFRREAQLAAKLTHHHTASIYAFGETPDRVLWIAMEYIEGESLHSVLAKDSPRQIADLLQPVADVLDRAGALGIIHRDVKPDNIIVSSDGIGRRAVLLDFGLARPMEDTDKLTQAGVAVGSPTYMSPEQVFGPAVDSATDRYALGVILYIAVAKRPPFRHDDRVQLVLMHKRQPVPQLFTLVPSFPPNHPLDAFFTRALAKQPQERYASAREMVSEFIRALDQVPMSDAPITLSSMPSIAPPAPAAPPARPAVPSGPPRRPPPTPPPLPGASGGAGPLAKSREGQSGVRPPAQGGVPARAGQKEANKDATGGDERKDPQQRDEPHKGAAPGKKPGQAPESRPQRAAPHKPRPLAAEAAAWEPEPSATPPESLPRSGPPPVSPSADTPRTTVTELPPEPTLRTQVDAVRPLLSEPDAAGALMDEKPAEVQTAPEIQPGLSRLYGRIAGSDRAVDVLCRTEAVMGKHRDCDVVCRAFPTPEQDAITHGVSRQHARLRVEKGRLFIEDLGSLNGTFLDDKKLADEPLPLYDEAQIRLGPVLTFQLRLFRSGAALLRRIDSHHGGFPATLLLWDRMSLGEPGLGLLLPSSDPVTRWGVLQYSHPGGEIYWGGPASVKWLRDSGSPSRPQALLPGDRLQLGDVVIEWYTAQKPGI